MPKKLIIYNGVIVNQGTQKKASIVIENSKIKDIVDNIQLSDYQDFMIIDATGKFVLPGIIDTHVHFREPGLTHKAEIYTESRAAAAGGVTTFFDMPNTIPQTIDCQTIDEKLKIAQKNSLINYSFFIGATIRNIEILSNIDKTKIPGIKVFYASSTGNMLVNEQPILDEIFKLNAPIVVHSEDNHIIKKMTEIVKAKYQNNLTTAVHPEIRNREACISATKQLVELAIKHNTKLHLLHITTADEVEFLSDIKLFHKNITAEATPNHLFFDNSNYEHLGNKIKCNPAIKDLRDKLMLIQGIETGVIDTVATDHAPHLLEEKQKPYLQAPSGIPSIQHSLNIMLEFVRQEHILIETIVEKMCHKPAKIFNIEKRGFIKKDYWADLTIVDMNAETKVEKENLLYKCGWSPLEGKIFHSKITTTIVNGEIVYDNGKIIDNQASMQVDFDRN